MPATKLIPISYVQPNAHTNYKHHPRLMESRRGMKEATSHIVIDMHNLKHGLTPEELVDWYLETDDRSSAHVLFLAGIV